VFCPDGGTAFDTAIEALRGADVGGVASYTAGGDGGVIDVWKQPDMLAADKLKPRVIVLPFVYAAGHNFQHVRVAWERGERKRGERKRGERKRGERKRVESEGGGSVCCALLLPSHFAYLTFYLSFILSSLSTSSLSSLRSSLSLYPPQVCKDVVMFAPHYGNDEVAATAVEQQVSVYLFRLII
tara:strand:- start:282 stop:833 length:552 start_codon:yes stop_codon:yes gene_type:complete